MRTSEAATEREKKNNNNKNGEMRNVEPAVVVASGSGTHDVRRLNETRDANVQQQQIAAQMRR